MSQDIQQFITDNVESASEAWRQLGGTEQFYRIGPVSLCVRHIGNTLINTISPAIRHAVVNCINNVDGTIYTLDASALNMQIPPAIWPFATDTHQGHQRIYWDRESGFALNSDESRGIWQLFNLKDETGLYWVADEQTLPSWETGSPLRIFLHWLSYKKGYQLIHAAGLEWNNCGILLTGRGGSGKSTTTAAAVNAGWNTIGDDFVLLANEKTTTACCIYDTIKLTQQSLDKITGMTDKAVNIPSSPDDKARVHLVDNFGQQLAKQITVNMLFVLQISNTLQTCILPVSKASMMNALAPTTMFMLKMGMKESFSRMTTLVNQVPCYVIKMSSNPQEVIEKLAIFVEKTKEQN